MNRGGFLKKRLNSLAHLHHFTNEAVEEAHELAAGEVDLPLQSVHRLVLQPHSQQQRLGEHRHIHALKRGTTLDVL